MIGAVGWGEGGEVGGGADNKEIKFMAGNRLRLKLFKQRSILYASAILEISKEVWFGIKIKEKNANGVCFVLKRKKR